MSIEILDLVLEASGPIPIFETRFPVGIIANAFTLQQEYTH